MAGETRVLETTPFGLLGRTLGHSWSPRIHTKLGSAPYGLFEREPQEVEEFIRKGDWRGINVTIPYKREAAQFADVVSDRVRRLGVANTLVRRGDGSVYADNTDVLGFAWMLERFCLRAHGLSAKDVLNGVKVLVLGTGGASRAVSAALEDLGAHVVAISRRGTETYATIVERHTDARLLVNCTPVGMFPQCPATPIPEDELAQLRNLKGVLDVVYNPERTALTLAADRLGIPSESGLAMLVAQAYHASQIFQGKDLDDALVEELEQEIRRATRNVVIIGMPGSGKTSSGRRLARITGRPFVDLDDYFAIDHGETPSQCILAHGEETFRALETQTASSYCSRSGLVIACGGGIVTKQRNYDIVHQNATVIMLDRPLSELSSEDRPISQSKGVERIAKERMGLYRTWADIVLPCTGSAQGDANKMREILGI